MGPPIFLLVTISIIGEVMAAETCLSQPQLFGVIFGSVAAAFLIAGTLAILMYICFRKNSEIKETDNKSAYANDACDVEDKAVDATKKTTNKDKMTMIDSFKLRKKCEDIGTQKAYSMEYINEVEGKVGVQLRAEDVSGLGFNIQGNMNEGIFVKEIIAKGIAEQSGNILVGDKIKSLTICFENMVYQDAITILSYASPYKVKLELERKLADNGNTSDSDEDKDARYHPLFRSNTLTHVHFNPLGSVSSSPKPQRCASANSNQKHALPKKEPVLIAEPDSTIVDESSIREDSSSRLESSDYGSDGTSECRESTASDGTQKTLSDRIEITDIIFDKVSSPTPPPHRKLEQCTELPPKVKKVVSRSPSPKHKPPPSPKMNRATSPIKPLRQEDSTTQTSKLRADTKPTQTDPPTPPPISSIPVRKENETQTQAPSIPIRPPTPPPATPSKIVEEEITPKGPEITEARVSRIPKRSDSIKTPVVERKLPALPKSVTQRSHSADKNDNVWSRLYQEKKGQLRKTRELSSPPTVHSGIPLPTSSKIVTSTTTPQKEDRYGTLTREKRDRLMANDAELDRQREELKKLGIL
ncbi:unnamed protein product [Caenorhabditis angaria]|uniref:PDZ domain-containing protein n=1 Tax=Caenorhabditis angaria TaxID=860376 RepID=A0A9P1N974_9PELO|nr:unnamed protein product [Caenorhabditis angaria]